MRRAAGPDDADAQSGFCAEGIETRFPGGQALRLRLEVGDFCRNRIGGGAEYTRQAHEREMDIKRRRGVLGRRKLDWAGERPQKILQLQSALQNDLAAALCRQRGISGELDQVAQTL